jgi:hypothetical protein
MALALIPKFRNRYYSCATTSSSGAPISTVVVVSRCKYLGGWFVPNNAGSAASNSFDVLSVTQATSLSSGLVSVLTSGVTVTTSTGTFATAFGGQGGSTPGSTAIVYFNPGDLILTVGSTTQAGFVTHVVEEF